MSEAIRIHFRKDIVAVVTTALELLSLPFIDCFRDLLRGGINFLNAKDPDCRIVACRITQ